LQTRLFFKKSELLLEVEGFSIQNVIDNSCHNRVGVGVGWLAVYENEDTLFFADSGLV
jgi:hypothetical protein